MRQPRILITGFSVFPGAPVNPTEHLIHALRSNPADLADLGELRTEILPVEYAAVPAILERLGADFAPDIAIHFGLSAKATGFTLERLARNEIARGKPDNAGVEPPATSIVEGAAHLPSTLPLQDIASELASAGLPVAWSDDAGGYLCNYLFYLSRSPSLPGFAPPVSGFVHVPPAKSAESDNPHALALEDLVRGATTITRTTARAWASPVLA